eukprot:CAMPEP_0176426640 /NCGR_PEP_ID=MMETSP0127-20121128/12064_1 /TAXON_ID=938130 /ORGANISM="Platyophrya macrostoma, Strain WH" /LENGTH=98 /DNA_ID=CAMNT_0017807949 /DNA_START=35 /DNA_END=331 /DNA_ORIENTATION=-
MLRIPLKRTIDRSRLKKNKDQRMESDKRAVESHPTMLKESNSEASQQHCIRAAWFACFVCGWMRLNGRPLGVFACFPQGSGAKDEGAERDEIASKDES